VRCWEGVVNSWAGLSVRIGPAEVQEDRVGRLTRPKARGSKTCRSTWRRQHHSILGISVTSIAVVTTMAIILRYAIEVSLVLIMLTLTLCSAHIRIL